MVALFLLVSLTHITAFTYLLWFTSTSDPILDVVNEMCSSPMTISSSCEKMKPNMKKLTYH